MTEVELAIARMRHADDVELAFHRLRCEDGGSPLPNVEETATKELVDTGAAALGRRRAARDHLARRDHDRARHQSSRLAKVGRREADRGDAFLPEPTPRRVSFGDLARRLRR